MLNMDDVVNYLYAQGAVEQLYGDAVMELEGDHKATLRYCEALKDTIKVLREEILVLEREFDIVDSAAEFWKCEAINGGYEE